VKFGRPLLFTGQKTEKTVKLLLEYRGKTVRSEDEPIKEITSFPLRQKSEELFFRQTHLSHFFLSPSLFVIKARKKYDVIDQWSKKSCDMNTDSVNTETFCWYSERRLMLVNVISRTM
jgi:hypothetical protein